MPTVPSEQDLDDLARQAWQFCVLSSENDQIGKRKTEVRAWIIRWLNKHSEPKDEKGNHEVLLPEPFTVAGKTYHRVTLQARTSTSLCEAAEKVLETLGLYEEATITETILVPEKVVDLWLKGKISDEDYQELWEHRSTTALIMR